VYNEIYVQTSTEEKTWKINGEPISFFPFRGHGCYFSEGLVNYETSQEPLSYTISIYIVPQMKKNPKKRGDSKNTVLRSEPEAIRDTFLTRLLVKIDRILKLKVIDFKDFSVTF
jgi:hypothetical protein